MKTSGFLTKESSIYGHTHLTLCADGKLETRMRKFYVDLQAVLDLVNYNFSGDLGTKIASIHMLVKSLSKTCKLWYFELGSMNEKLIAEQVRDHLFMLCHCFVSEKKYHILEGDSLVQSFQWTFLIKSLVSEFETNEFFRNQEISFTEVSKSIAQLATQLHAAYDDIVRLLPEELSSPLDLDLLVRLLQFDEILSQFLRLHSSEDYPLLKRRNIKVCE